ncbi:MAG: response regulator transcription factor [Planctomycetales bacterium]|nr:response regulator transcription factor [Planctomycetales bacterium]
MTILLVTTDLMAASMLAGAAKSASAELQVSSPTAAAEAVTTHPPQVVIVDLGSLAGDATPVLQSIRDASPDARLIAFGPHVHKQKLEQAKAAGYDRVMSRGEFFSRAGEVIAGA